MGIIAWIIVGIVAGFLAKLVVRGEGPGGILGDLIIGVLGALLGGFIWVNVLHHAAGLTGLNFPTLLVAFVGAVILLLLLRLFGRKAA